MINIRKPLSIFLILALILIAVVSGCDPNAGAGGSDDGTNNSGDETAVTGPSSNNASIPDVPPSLSGGNTSAYSRALSSSDFFTEYSHFVCVPEVAWNYQTFKNNTLEAALVLQESSEDWVEIESEDFDYEIEGDVYTLRVNDDMTNIEYHSPGDAPVSDVYFRTIEHEGYSHTLLLNLNMPGNPETQGYTNSHDLIELIETDTKVYTKCIRMHELFFSETDNLLQHFVGVTDLGSATQNTTGRILKEYVTNPSTTFEREPGADADTDYYNIENIPDGFEDGDYYGFFNDTDYYVVTPADWETSGDYLNPDDLRSLFSEGLANSMISSIISALDDPDTEADFGEWDTSQY